MQTQSPNEQQARELAASIGLDFDSLTPEELGELGLGEPAPPSGLGLPDDFGRRSFGGTGLPNVQESIPFGQGPGIPITGEPLIGDLGIDRIREASGGEIAQQVGGGFARGAFGSVGAMVDGLQAVMDRMLGPFRPPTREGDPGRYLTPEQLAAEPSMRELLSGVVSEVLPPVEELQGTILTDVAEGAGTMLPGLGAGLAAKGAGAVGRLLSIAGTSALQEGSTAYQEALDAGASQEEAFQVFVATGAGSGVLDALPLFAVLERIDKGSGGGLSKAVASLVKEGASESATEVAQLAWQDAIAQHVYANPEDAATLSEYLRAGLAGGLTGSLLSGVASGVQAAQERISAEAAQAPPVEPQAQEALGSEQGEQVQPGAVQGAQGPQGVEAPTEEPERLDNAPPPETLTLPGTVDPQSVEAAPEVPVTEVLPADAETIGPSTEPVRPDSETTGIRNEIVETELAALGFSSQKRGETTTFEEQNEKAAQIEAGNPFAGTELVRELGVAPRALEPTETALLGRELNRRIVARERLEDEFNAAQDDDTRNLIGAQIEQVQAAYLEAADAAGVAGTANAQALALRAAIIRRDYSIASMERAKQRANNGAPMTEEQRAEVRAAHRKVEEAQRRYDEYVSQTTQSLEQIQAEVAKLEAEIDAEPSRGRPSAASRARGGLRQQADAARQRIRKRLEDGSSFYSGVPITPDEIVDYAIIGADYIAQGVTDFAAWSQRMVAEFGEKIQPHLDAIFGEAEKQAASDQESALEAVKRRLRGQIKSLQSQIDSGERRKTPSDEEVAALREELSRVQRQYNDVFRDEIREDRIPNAIKTVEKSIADYERRIAEKDLAPKGKAEPLSSPELDALRARRDALRQELNALRKEAEPKRDPDEVRLQAYKTRTRNRIADLRERIAREDFATEERRPLELDDEALDLKADLEAAKRDWKTELERDRLRNRTAGQRFRDNVAEILNLPRQLISSFDLSAMLRQGSKFTVAHPVQALDAAGKMLRAFASEKESARIDIALRSRPNAGLGDVAGLDLTRQDDPNLMEREEFMVSRIAQALPGVEASNRAYTTYLNVARAFLFDRMVDGYPGKITPEIAKDIAREVNIATGRGDFGKHNKALPTLNKIFWSPRLYASSIQQILAPARLGIYSQADPYVRKEVAKLYARYIAGMAAAYGLASLLDIGDQEWDPRSSDFGKIRLGDSRIDPLAGLAQFITFGSRIAAQESKSTKSGEVYPLDGFNDSDAVVMRMLRTKLTPVLGGAWNVVTGEDLVGNEVTPEGQVLRLAVPLTFQDMYEVMREDGYTKAAALGMLSIFGFGVNHHSERKDDDDE